MNAALMLVTRQDGPTTFAEADPPESFAFAISAKDHFIAVLQKSTDFACGQIDRLGAAPGQLDQTTHDSHKTHGHISFELMRGRRSRSLLSSDTSVVKGFSDRPGPVFTSFAFFAFAILVYFL